MGTRHRALPVAQGEYFAFWSKQACAEVLQQNPKVWSNGWQACGPACAGPRRDLHVMSSQHVVFSRVQLAEALSPCERWKRPLIRDQLAHTLEDLSHNDKQTAPIRHMNDALPYQRSPVRSPGCACMGVDETCTLTRDT